MAAIVSAALVHPGYCQSYGRDDDRELPGRRRSPMEVTDLPSPTVSIAVEGEYRIIRSNGLPNHTTGEFPNAQNPNSIRPQSHEYRVPLHPKVADRLTPARPEFGIALNGVIFDAGTGEFWSADGQRHGPGGKRAGGGSGESVERRGPRRRPPRGGGPGRSGPRGGPDAAWNYDALSGGAPFGIDQNHAHVQPTGKYHYHGVPTGLLESLGLHAHDDGHFHAHEMILIGWALDGFPIYAPYGYADPKVRSSDLVELKPSYRLKAGERPEPPTGPAGSFDGTFSKDWEYVEGLGDLDECNGRFGITPEFPEGSYYYVVTETYPAVPRLWRGTPGSSAKRRGGSGSSRGEKGTPPPLNR